MISSIFVDRPRLALVIALIITMAGGWRCFGSRSRSFPTSCRRR